VSTDALANNDAREDAETSSVFDAETEGEEATVKDCIPDTALDAVSSADVFGDADARKLADAPPDDDPKCEGERDVDAQFETGESDGVPLVVTPAVEHAVVLGEATVEALCAREIDARDDGESPAPLADCRLLSVSRITVAEIVAELLVDPDGLSAVAVVYGEADAEADCAAADGEPSPDDDDATEGDARAEAVAHTVYVAEFDI